MKEHLRFPWKLSFSAWTLLVIACVALVVFFRTYRLTQVPPEMVSDHAEKLLDVWDVLHGQPSIFFPRNTGREAIQMYLTAGIIQLFHTGYTFLSLKLGTILAGLLTLPYIYLLGKELANRRVGLFALLFAGIGYWPNVISRVGLRFPLYPLFVAPTLFYLIRGLRTSNRNDFILAGLFLGIGLHGYTPIRILPILVVVAVGLFLLHPQAKGKRLQVVSGLLVLVLISLIVFLPLLRFSLEFPTLFDFRAFSRLGITESPLPGPAALIFIKESVECLDHVFLVGWQHLGPLRHRQPGPGYCFSGAVLPGSGVVAGPLYPAAHLAGPGAARFDPHPDAAVHPLTGFSG